MVSLTNAEIVTYLSHGYSLTAIATETGISVRTIQSRLLTIMKISGSKTKSHVVANFLRKKLIE